jgi:cytidylate kinase
VQARDARDMGRVEAPLKPANDAVQIDTSDMSIDAAVVRAIAVIEARSTHA